ncbi:4-hydroxy-3-methylbut-2-enyl diphosphate reductase [Schinkia azotoformans]|uniref:4-hydroxy-3-methylbut-2-enyl diphosphate reductase n=1 Tax=Schinkia azotoformans LMG 9581 TaxID=1131731 RepID=K6D2V5_SCHAZ|nr:4-hydroxy-3-methylbut-2-enyl diphosphate reductase [Schinkia azotoformans]EKN62388.1 4-hydroxy-3-methylbut-2-enyl diphosphate reductase [Schinkia azotoformans LMG 9581]MEC1640622.1 4-hydroxy-3-methylbut-2-enyl diphosphate reductase [Schinkia azotoformans]MEC1944493.1 4-hydroxy-3-methylbut-2-enyl diphosphate reductase [Schinkia azotoformans]
MEVLKIAPRGYCHGVVDAMVIAQNAALDKSLPRPIYILGMIVHNQHVTEAFEKEDIKTLDIKGKTRKELLDEITEGTVIFTAHGTSPEVIQIARDRGLTVLDATCPDVTRTHDLIRSSKDKGYQVIYIGKKGHPEPEGAVGVAPDIVHLIENEDDIEKLEIDCDKIVVTNQTTMSQWDVADVMKKVKEKYPHAEIHNEICMATQMRQEAVAEQAHDADLTIVVGDPRSNNSNRLAQVSEEIAGTTAYRVADVTEIDVNWLKNINKVAVTAGASTPTPITKEVIAFLEQFDPNDESTWNVERRVTVDKILPKIKR